MYPKPVKNFIDKFSKLPSIGPRQAARLAFWLLNEEKNIRDDLKKALEELDNETDICPVCFFVTVAGGKEGNGTSRQKPRQFRHGDDQSRHGDGNCHFCNNPARDHQTICVVEKETDLTTIEKSGGYKGLYHVLGGLFSALDTAIPKKLKIPELINRVETKKNDGKKIEEIILALSPTHEGDLTAHYLERLLKPLKIKITRLGRGLPYGADVEFADAQTLSGALDDRKEIK
ncbi:MAG: toprim domain-containing protein [Candidatus Azambacteria bacterium]|nr:toprim domain-containing protein [Candidatus Azambacteria bacterium]